MFRIIRECLTNAIRHGQAEQVHVNLKLNNGAAEISIHDDGVGMKDASEPGLGFKTMQHYAELMNGKLNFESANGSGTKIMLTFPNT